MMAKAATPLTNHEEWRAMVATVVRASALPAEATEPAPAPTSVAQQDPASVQVLRELAQAPAYDTQPDPTSCELIDVQTCVVTMTHRQKMFVSIRE